MPPEPPTAQGDASAPAIPELPLPKPSTRAERVRALRGKYAWIRVSSDDLVRRKHEEMKREEH
jgi:hypothetical protein